MILLIVLASIVAGWMIIGGIVYGVVFVVMPLDSKEFGDLGMIFLGSVIWPVVLGTLIGNRIVTSIDYAKSETFYEDVPW